MFIHCFPFVTLIILHYIMATFIVELDHPCSNRITEFCPNYYIVYVPFTLRFTLDTFDKELQNLNTQIKNMDSQMKQRIIHSSHDLEMVQNHVELQFAMNPIDLTVQPIGESCIVVHTQSSLITRVAPCDKEYTIAYTAKNIVILSKTKCEPCVTQGEPSAAMGEPCVTQGEPSAAMGEPCAAMGEPCAEPSATQL